MGFFKSKQSSGGYNASDRGGFSAPRKFGAGARSGGGSYSRGGNSDERPTMHDTVCSKCGNACQVPFKPNGKKPVFCNNCFIRDDAGASAPRFGAGRSDRGERGSEGRGDRANEGGFRSERSSEGGYSKPAFEKPAYRSTPRFGASERTGGGAVGVSNEEVVSQLRTLNKKMDRLIQVLSKDGAGGENDTANIGLEEGGE
ncbi:MAG: CxxC-x17-CxxC domain-containing protein [Patescibacteria group bacterium]